MCKENESLKEEISELKQDKLSLNEKLLELQSRSMQENLLFFGIDESLSDDRSKSEDTERFLKDFVKTNVSSEDNNIVADSIQFDRVHRLG